MIQSSAVQERERPEAPRNDSNKDKRTWNSLEIVKLMVSASVPILLLLFGREFSKEQSRQAEEKSRVDQAVRKRLELWDKIAVPLNDTYCYFLCVGNWKELSATNILAHKRLIDQTVYGYRPFFSDRFYNAYEQFANACFDTYRRFPEEPRLRTKRKRPLDSAMSADWFVETENEGQIHLNYYELLRFMSEELNLPPTQMPEAPDRPGDAEFATSALIYDLQIRFHTREPKKADTVVSVSLQDQDGVEYASGSATGSYRENSDKTLTLVSRQPVLLGDVPKLKLVIRIEPKLPDKWTFDYVIVGATNQSGDFHLRATKCELSFDPLKKSGTSERTDALKNLKL